VVMELVGFGEFIVVDFVVVEELELELVVMEECWD